MSDHDTGPRSDDVNNRLPILLLIVAAMLVPTAPSSFGNSPDSIIAGSLGNSADTFMPTSFGNFDSAPLIAAGAPCSFGNLGQATPRDQWGRSVGAPTVHPIGAVQFVRQFSVARPDFVSQPPRDTS